MAKLNSLLLSRFKTGKKEKENKLAQRFTSEELSSFAGIFQIAPIKEREKEALHNLLKTYQTESAEITEDLIQLIAISSEVKAISSQAIILHGERIKKAQLLLKKYRDGAFSAFLIATYGNRQTPYNFLLYYELYSSLSKEQRAIVNEMPRQVIYSLSSRNISHEEKVTFIEKYKGETKKELLNKIRQIFPLAKEDQRRSNQVKKTIDFLTQAVETISSSDFFPSTAEKQKIEALLCQMKEQLEESS